jgi:hypothetical protein
VTSVSQHRLFVVAKAAIRVALHLRIRTIICLALKPYSKVTLTPERDVQAQRVKL